MCCCTLNDTCTHVITLGMNGVILLHGFCHLHLRAFDSIAHISSRMYIYAEKAVHSKNHFGSGKNHFGSEENYCILVRHNWCLEVHNFIHNPHNKDNPRQVGAGRQRAQH